MPGSEFDFRADDGQTLLARRWLPEGPPRAVVQIAHGLAEHSARYARLAAALNAAGYAAYANDHRGHGPKAAPGDRAAGAADRPRGAPAARQARQEQPHLSDVVRRVQQAVQARAHRLRLALARRKASRRLRRRSA